LRSAVLDEHLCCDDYITSPTIPEGDLLTILSSVADPGCLSRIPDPDFYPSRIQDLGSRIQNPKTATKERGENFFFDIPFYVGTNFTKLNIILVLKG
jgi:hypothetical protein